MNEPKISNSTNIKDISCLSLPLKNPFNFPDYHKKGNSFPFLATSKRPFDVKFWNRNLICVKLNRKFGMIEIFFPTDQSEKLKRKLKSKEG